MSLDGHWCKLTGRRRRTTLMILVYLEFPLPLPLQTWNDCDGNCCIILSFWGYGERKSSFVLSLLFSISLPCPEALVVWPVWRSGSWGRKLLCWDLCAWLVCYRANTTCQSQLQHAFSFFRHTQTHTHIATCHTKRDVCLCTFVFVCAVIKH